MTGDAEVTMNFVGNVSMTVNRASEQWSLNVPDIYQNEPKENTKTMNYEFMLADIIMPPYIPLPKATVQLPISSTAKVMYARLLEEILTEGIEDSNGILYICFPIMELAIAICRSPMTVKRALNELEQAGMIMRIRQSVGEASHIYILIPERNNQIE